MSQDISLTNHSEHFNTAYINGGQGMNWIGHLVHPVIHAAIYLVLTQGSDAAKAAIRKIIDTEWYPGVFSNAPENAITAVKYKYWGSLTSDDRQQALEYNRLLRMGDVGYFDLEYMERRFNARTPTFQNFRAFYLHLKHTDAEFLYREDDQSK